MKVHAIVDAHGTLIATGAVPADGSGPRVQLRPGPGQTRHELELPHEFESKSPTDVHKELAARGLKPYIVGSHHGPPRK